MNARKKDVVWIVIGIVVTVLFLVFGTPIYECLYYSSEFSNEIYNSNMYFVIAIVTTIVCWGVAVIYYLLIDKDKFSRFWHWFFTLVIVLLLTPVITYVCLDNELSNTGMDFTTQLGHFALINMVVAFVLFIVVSFSIKGLSKNLTSTPF